MSAAGKPMSPLEAEHDLLDRARRAAAQAYAPYSKFRLGAAVRTSTGAIFTGCNVENASYGLTNCAERTAIFSAVASEGAHMRLTAIAIFVDSAQAFPPCGACRQVIAEFAAPEAVVLYQSVGNDAVRTTIAELLPRSFRL